MSAVRIRANGVAFAVRLTPKGGRDAIAGWQAAADGKVHLKARVAAAPDKDKANEALIALLAKALGVPKSAVSIAKGQTARNKTVEIAGDAAILKARLAALGEAS